MGKKQSNLLFNFIAPIYSLFYNGQKEKFSKILNDVKEEIDLSNYNSVIDIGCGTGALSAVLNEMNLEVTGIDAAKNMLAFARKKQENEAIQLIQANVLEGLPFEDDAFDIAMASYVAHGLKAEERKKMYAEMGRLAKDYVIIHDYNKNKTLLTSIIEWLEGGDYFYFIENAAPEMKDCVSEMKTCFSDVQVIQVDNKANWYICQPKEH